MLVKLTGLVVATACMAFLNPNRRHHTSQEDEAYPRSRMEPWFEKYQKANRKSIRRSTGADLQMWMTDDAFEQVVSHYNAMGVERPEFAKSFGKTMSEKSGHDVKLTYVIFDGAEGPVLSKHYVSIQRPVIIRYEPLEVHDVTAIGLYRMKK